MKRASLVMVRPDVADLAPPLGEAEAAPLLHLRITGRHGVFLLEQSPAEQALVDTRAPGGIACTCGAGADCPHVALLRACGFLDKAA